MTPNDTDLAIIEHLRVYTKRSNEVTVEDNFEGTWSSGYWYGKVVAMRDILLAVGYTMVDVDAFSAGA